MAKIEAEMAARRLPEMYFAAEAPHIWSWRTAEYGSFVLDLSEKLALTDTQQGQIRDLQREHKRQTIERRADLEVAELDLKTLQSAETLDLEAIRDQLEVVSGLKIEEQIAGLQLKHDIQQVLTLEQRDQLEEIDKKFGPRKVSVLKRKR
jgi:Spy/CpxP family protein refolding chaperone